MDPWDDLFRENLKVSQKDLLASEQALMKFSAALRQRRQRLWYSFSAAAACVAVLGGSWFYQWQDAPLPHTVAYEAYSQVNGAW